MPALADLTLARFSAGGASTPPEIEALVRELLFPGSDPEAGRYLELRPGLRRGLAATLAHIRAESHRAIALAAYYKFLGRGGRDGRDVDDWLEAEWELVCKRLGACAA